MGRRVNIWSIYCRPYVVRVNSIAVPANKCSQIFEARALRGHLVRHADRTLKVFMLCIVAVSLYLLCSPGSLVRYIEYMSGARCDRCP